MGKVLFISHKYPPSVGGMEKQSYELIKGMSKYVDIISITFDSAKENKFQFFWQLKSRVKSTLHDHPEISVIHLNDGLMAAFSLWLKDITDLPIFVTFHGLDLTFPSFIYQKHVLHKIKTYSGFFAVSSFTSRMLVKRGFDESKIHVVKNGVDISSQLLTNTNEDALSSTLIPIKNKKLLLAVGRPVKRKGFSWFVKNILSELPEDFVFLIAGSFDQKQSKLEQIIGFLPSKLSKLLCLFFGIPDDKIELRKLAKQSEYKNKLHLLPRLSDDDLNKIYSLSDLFLMPNIKVKGDMEGFGLVALEASVKGLPVLVSGIEGIRDAIQDEKNGYAIESEHAVVWREKILKLFSTGEQLAINAEAFRDYTVNNYSWNKMCFNYYRVLKDYLPIAQKVRHYNSYINYTASKDLVLVGQA